MDSVDRERRRFLSLVGTGALVAVAGCTGSAGERTSSSPGTGTASPTETTTETTTERPDPPMSTVFHFSGAESEQKHAVANVSNLLGDDSVDLGDVALVANGSGLRLLVTGDSIVEDGVASLVDQGVTLCACHNSMKAFGVTESDLLSPEIEVVSSGVGALTKFQARDGYAYIKTP